MSEISIPSSSDSIEKAIDEYYDSSNDNSSDNSSHSNEGSSSNEGYTSGVPRLPLEVVQEQLRKASGSEAGISSSVPLSSPWTRRRSSTVAQLVSIPKQMSKGFVISGRGIRSRTSVTLGYPSVENGATILVLE